MKVFISYSKLDKGLAEKFVMILKEMGIDYFCSGKDDASSDFEKESIKGLSECSILVVVVSPASLSSTWVPFEIGHALGAGKNILLLLSSGSLTVPGYLRGLHYRTSPDEAKEYFRYMLDRAKEDAKLGMNKPGSNDLEILNYRDKKSIQDKTPCKKSTGIKALDIVLEGGIACGSVVNITADPRAMAEVWLYQIAQVDRTFYFTTEKSPKDIQDSINLPDFNLDNIYFIDIYSHYINGISNNDILNLTENYLEKISNNAEAKPIIIFDNFSFYLNLDIDPKSLKSFINYISKKAKNIEAVLYLYTLKQKNNQLEDVVYSLSDTIFEIGFKKHSERITNYLSVLKNKKGSMPRELIRLKFEEGSVQIDTSKDVA